MKERELGTTTIWQRVQAWPRWLFATVLAVAALGMCAWFYPPRLAVFGKKDVRLQEWVRAETFLQQCVDPARRDIEPAMQWRLLPPVICHVLGLRGAAALAVPWLGLLGLLAVLAARLEDLTGRRDLAAVGVLGFATGSGAVTVVDWLGINDGWYLLALLITATSRSRLVLVIAGLLGPWVDERYLVGLPLALVVRWQLLNPQREPGWIGRQLALVVLGCAPYVLFRSWFSLRQGDAASSDYLLGMASVYRYYAPYIPAGWALGFRALWLPVGAALLVKCKLDEDWRPVAATVALALLTLAVMSVMAWDLSRSVAIILPVFVLAIVSAAHASRAGGALRLWGAAVLVNLCLPYAHVVGPTLTWNHGPLNLWGWMGL